MLPLQGKTGNRSVTFKNMICPRHFECLRAYVFAITLALAIHTAAGASTQPVPGQTLLDETDYPAFAVTGDGTARVVLETATTADARILKITTTEEGAAFPKISATLRHSTPLRRREIIHARFLMRTPHSARESGEGAVQFELEDASTFAISGQYSARAVGQWREFNIPLRLVRECPPGRAVVNFRVGDRQQTIEISGLRIIRPEPAITDIKTLPATPVQIGYEGSEPGAAWRTAANERIKQHRRSPLSITVRDAAGNPVPDARIHVAQQRHAYRFGAAVRADTIVADNPRAARYRETIRRHFNAVTFMNDLKWGSWLRDSATPLAAAQWCRDNGITLRGHTILWPTNRRLPAQFSSIANDPAALRATIDAHIADIAGRTSPFVHVWDVVNEPFRNHDFMDLLGPDAMSGWFRLARRCAPNARLYLNDYGIVTGGGMDSQHQAACETTIRGLIADGAPLDGLGIQGHFDRILTPPSLAVDILDRFARLGREIEMTEYTTQVEDRDLAASYLRDMLTVFYSHPSTTGFILWSFIQGSGYPSTTTLQDREGKLTAAGRVWHDLIYKQWWTDARLVTASDGRASIPATHGSYVIMVQSGANKTTATADVGPDGTAVGIEISDTIASLTRQPQKDASQ